MEKMKIEIIINKEQADHLQSPHMFIDECVPACDVLKKVQKEIDKKRKDALEDQEESKCK